MSYNNFSEIAGCFLSTTAGLILLETIDESKITSVTN